MCRIVLIGCFALLLSCNTKQPKPSLAQEIVNGSIAICGGERYTSSRISFKFRNRMYALKRQEKQKVLTRTIETDSGTIKDVRYPDRLNRFVGDREIALPDSLSRAYANAINSVHYFAYLPYGLNDAAVNKEYLGEEKISGNPYHKIRITFDEEGGGDDHEDVFLYWFHKETLKPDFLAYTFQVNGGGIRFRKAYNERYVNGIRFVDYLNYEPMNPDLDFEKIAESFRKGELKLLSKIELQNIKVSLGSYN